MKDICCFSLGQKLAVALLAMFIMVPAESFGFVTVGVNVGGGYGYHGAPPPMGPPPMARPYPPPGYGGYGGVRVGVRYRGFRCCGRGFAVVRIRGRRCC